MQVYHGVLVPSGVLVLWHGVGLLSYPLLTDRASPNHRITKGLLQGWTLLILVCYSYFFAIEVIVFSQTYQVELRQLEFFTMILLIYREYFFLLPIIIILGLLVWNRTIPALLISVEAAVADILEPAQKKYVRMFHCVSWAVMAAIVVGTAYCTYAGFRLMLSEMAMYFPDVSWWNSQPIDIVTGGAVSYFGMAVIYGHGFSYATICWSAPPTLIVGLVLALGFGFGNIGRELKVISRESHIKSGSSSSLCQRITRLRDDHRRLRVAVTDINTTVAFITILSTFGDILMSISLISRILQDPSDDIMARLQNECLKFGVYFFSTCAIIQGIIRIAAFVWMHEQAKKAKRHLHHIGLHAFDQDVRDTGRNFEEEIAENPEELAVSGNDFFSMTKNFAATLFGIVLTYFLLIYQQKDQKGDLDKLSKEQQTGFRNLAALIEELNQRLNGTMGERNSTPSV